MGTCLVALRLRALRLLFAVLVATTIVQTSMMACAAPIVASIHIGSDIVSPATLPYEGTLQLWLSPDEVAAFSLVGYQVRIALDGPDDLVRFTGVSAPTIAPYVFDPISTSALFSVDGDGQGLTLGDYLLEESVVVAGDVGIATISFEALAGAVGTYHVRIETDLAETFLADEIGLLSFAVQDGAILVVPEPATFGLCALGIMGLLASYTLRTKRGDL